MTHELIVVSYMESSLTTEKYNVLKNNLSAHYSFVLKFNLNLIKKYLHQVMGQ